MFLLFAARGSVEDSAAPSSSGRLLHINFCNYKSVISENIHSPPVRGNFFSFEPRFHLEAPVCLQTFRETNFPVHIFWKHNFICIAS